MHVTGCNYILHLGHTIFLNTISNESNTSLETLFWFMYISWCCFYHPYCALSKLKNANDVLVNIFFSCRSSVWQNILLILCRSCVCWASGCCWDKRLQRDRKNKKKTVLVSPTFMWRIRRRVSPGLLLYLYCTRNNV